MINEHSVSNPIVRKPGIRVSQNPSNEEAIQSVMESEGGIIADVVYDQSLLAEYMVSHSRFVLDAEFTLDTHDIVDPTPLTQLFETDVTQPPPSEQDPELPAILTLTQVRVGEYTLPIGLYSNPNASVTIPVIQTMSINTTSLPGVTISVNNMTAIAMLGINVNNEFTVPFYYTYLFMTESPDLTTLTMYQNSMGPEGEILRPLIDPLLTENPVDDSTATARLEATVDNVDKKIYTIEKTVTYTVKYATRIQEEVELQDGQQAEDDLVATFKVTTDQTPSGLTSSIPAGFVKVDFVEGNLLPKMLPGGKVYMVEIIKRGSPNIKYFTPDPDNPGKYLPELPMFQSDLAWITSITKGLTATVQFELIAQYWPQETFINNRLFDGKLFLTEGKGSVQMPLISTSDEYINEIVAPRENHRTALTKLHKKVGSRHFKHGCFHDSHIPIFQHFCVKRNMITPDSILEDVYFHLAEVKDTKDLARREAVRGKQLLRMYTTNRLKKRHGYHKSRDELHACTGMALCDSQMFDLARNMKVAILPALLPLIGAVAGPVLSGLVNKILPSPPTSLLAREVRAIQSKRVRLRQNVQDQLINSVPIPSSNVVSKQIKLLRSATVEQGKVSAIPLMGAANQVAGEVMATGVKFMQQLENVVDDDGSVHSVLVDNVNELEYDDALPGAAANGFSPGDIRNVNPPETFAHTVTYPASVAALPTSVNKEHREPSQILMKHGLLHRANGIATGLDHRIALDNSVQLTPMVHKSSDVVDIPLKDFGVVGGIAIVNSQEVEGDRIGQRARTSHNYPVLATNMAMHQQIRNVFESEVTHLPVNLNPSLLDATFYGDCVAIRTAALNPRNKLMASTWWESNNIIEPGLALDVPCIQRLSSGTTHIGSAPVIGRVYKPPNLLNTWNPGSGFFMGASSNTQIVAAYQDTMQATSFGKRRFFQQKS